MVRSKQIHGLRFRRQHKIGQFIVDFYCHKANLVIETDGEIHKDKEKEDQVRTNFLRGLGLTVLRFANNQILKTPNEVKRQIEIHIQGFHGPIEG